MNDNYHSSNNSNNEEDICDIDAAMVRSMIILERILSGI